MSLWYQLSDGLFVSGYTGPEIASVKENGLEMLKKTSVSTIVQNSFFHDSANGRIYIIASDSTNLNSNGYTYVAYTWIGFTNVQEQNNRIVFPIQGQTEVYEYKPFLDMQRLPTLRSTIPELYRLIVVSSLGSIAFSNSIWWYENRENYLWHNAICVLKRGNAGDAYGSYITVFTGILTNPEFMDEGCSFTYEDIMFREMRTIPQERFSGDVAEYPDIDPAYIDVVKPVLLGKKTNITPVPTDTKNYTYTVSAVNFGADSFSLNAILAVYKDGAALTITTDYTVDLNAGTFTLVEDPGDSVITCDAEGLKISYNFTTQTWGGNYTQNIAEITFFILHKLNEIPVSNIDLVQFSNLKTTRPQECGLYLQTETDTSELIKRLQPSGEFHLLTDLSGKLSVPAYSRSAAPAEPDDSITEYDMSGFRLFEDTANIHSRAIVKYNEDPTNLKYLRQLGTRANVGYKYQAQKDIIFETILTDLEGASDLAATLIEFFDEPAVYMSGQITTGYGFDKKPLDKIFVTRNVFDEKNRKINIFEREPFMIKEIAKDLNTNTVMILAIKDLAQISGQKIDDHNLNHVQDHNFNELET